MNEAFGILSNNTCRVVLTAPKMPTMGSTADHMATRTKFPRDAGSVVSIKESWEEQAVATVTYR